MSDYSKDGDYGRMKRRSSFFPDAERKPASRQRHERSRSRDIHQRHSYHGSRSDRSQRDRSRSPYRNQDSAKRIYSTEYQSPKRRRSESSDEDEYPRRHRSLNRSPPQRSHSPRVKHKRSHHSEARDSRSSPRRSYDSGSNYRQSEHRKYSLSPTSRHRHRKSRQDRSPRHDRSPKHDRSSKHTANKSNSPHRHRSRPAAKSSPPPTRSIAPLPSQQDAYNQKSLPHPPPPPSSSPAPPKQKPNYLPSGKLAAETNTVANTSIVLKYHEPPSARLPPSTAPWRLYIYKGPDLLETLELHTRSCWLFGRERLVVDVPTEHPSCSKQHAVIQFRHLETKNAYGDREGGVRPYVIDLDSANGTRVNEDLLPGRQYVELKSGDLLRFGESGREYVLLLPPKD